MVVSKEIELNQHIVFTKLAVALAAVLVDKFAVDDGGGGNLHDGSPRFGLDSKEILAEKGRLKTGFWVFRRPYKDLKLTISWKTWIRRYHLPHQTASIT